MNPRLAAGAGVVSVFLLVSGSGAAFAYAHPGDSRGSDRGHSADRGGNHGRGSASGKHDNDRRDVKRPAGSKRSEGTNGPGAAPESRVGSGREDLAQPSSSNRSAAAAGPESASRAAPPDASASRTASSSRAATPDASANRSAAAAPPVEAPAAIAVTGGPVASGGSGAANAPASAFEPPQVTIGNGRAPQSRYPQTETRWPSTELPAPGAVPALPVLPPPLSPTPLSPTPLDAVATPPAAVRQFVVAPGAGTSDPLWGLAGLLLIPVAGAALGYRQARAAQAAERIGRS
ncbi:hypothetical protein AU197_16560 [Mycobacterium sp. IS-1590]|uniref:hypothetical protein n=1 Tax=Mycobacterium sp. IS-1590 TaxID=1772286 RepID=UPI000747B4B9|nr:hypothetical protein [Mycobacterium sp. IS-1590]KUI42677.1 hypothetical protein AU197_16560 [Mycobacterium sp. IS-1590]